jgi:hypothetical protein
MTRKDYELIASRIKQQVSDDPAGHHIAGETLENLAMSLAEDFKKSNPAFQPARFIAACGFNA